MGFRLVPVRSSISRLLIEQQNEFDLEVVLEGLRKCWQPDGSIPLDEYIFAFKELCRYELKFNGN